MIKQYSSFKGIDEQLKILKLKRKIDKESVKLNLNKSIIELYPSNLWGELGGIFLKFIIPYVTEKMLKKFL